MKALKKEVVGVLLALSLASAAVAASTSSDRVVLGSAGDPPAGVSGDGMAWSG